jgi:hypothetical protein
VQDYYGGSLARYAVKGKGIAENHYCNILENGTLIDTTRSQYKVKVTLQEYPVDLKGYKSVREKRLADLETRLQYEELKRSVKQTLTGKQ